jgi:hypothetical protein
MKSCLTDKARRWQASRSALNHDWLTSRFDRDLYGWLGIFEGEDEDEVFNAQTFEPNTIAEWRRRSIEVRDLIAGYEDAMTPAGLLDVPPLVDMPEISRRWLRDLVHFLWKARCDVAGQKTDAAAALDAADSVFAQIREAYEKDGFDSLVANMEILELLREAIKRCRALGKVISRLNHEIEVV